MLEQTTCSGSAVGSVLGRGLVSRLVMHQVVFDPFNGPQPDALNKHDYLAIRVQRNPPFAHGCGGRYGKSPATSSDAPFLFRVDELYWCVLVLLRAILLAFLEQIALERPMVYPILCQST